VRDGSLAHLPMMNARKSGEVELEASGKETTLRDFEGISEIEFSRVRKESESETSRLEPGWTSHGWLLWEHRSLLSKGALRALLAATIVVFLIPSRFESTTNIMPPEQGDHGALLSLLAGRSGSGGTEGASPGALASLAGSFLGTSSSGALYVELIHSRTVEDHIIDRFDLQKVYGARYKQDARKKLEKLTTVEQDHKSGVISISVTDSSPQRAREMAQAYVEELDLLLSRVSTSSARRERIFIEQRLASVKSDLESAEKTFGAFASKNTALDIKEQSKAEVEAAAELQGQLIAAQSELQGLAQIYTSNNVRVRSLRARMDELQRQLERISGTDASLAADASDASSSDMYPSIRKLPLLGVQWADLYRKAKIQETVYQLLNQQYELTRIQEAKEIPTILVIDPANLPEKKSWPPRLLIILFLTSFSLMVTAGCVVGSAYWQRVDPRNPGKVLVTRMWKAISQDTRNLMERLPLGGIRSRLFSKPGAGTPES
jgi:capsule polysaccharide export protein KpsE/RkpR